MHPDQTLPPPPTLSVTADDFGIGVETSRGIIEAHLAGAVDATSVMTVTGDHLLRSLPLLQQAPGLRLGLHLTLTSHAGRPLRAGSTSGLVGRDGNFLSLPALLFKSHTPAAQRRQISHQAVEDEIRTQLDAFKAALRQEPSHVDGHHHCHQLPVVRDVVAKLIREGVLPRQVRSTIEPDAARNIRGGWSRRTLIGFLGSAARPAFSAAGATLTDGFCGVLSTQMLTLPDPWAQYRSAIGSLPSGRFEMMVHPGQPDATLAGRDSYVAERVVELAALVRFGQESRSR